MDNKLNAVVNDVVQDYVNFIERSKKCRVVRCSSLFILAHSGRLYLWRTKMCDTIPITLPSVEESSSADFYSGPRAVDERLVQRAKAEEFRQPDAQLIDAILASPTPNRKTQLLPASQSQPQLGSSSEQQQTAFNPFDDGYSHARDSGQAQLRDAHDWDKAMQFLPLSSTLSRGRRRALSAAHLVSSQKRGCGGDYCYFSVHDMSAKRMIRGSRAGNALRGAPATGDGVGGALSKDAASVNGKGRHNSVVSATAAANAFVAAQQAANASRRDSAFDLKPRSPQRQQRDSHGGGNTADSSTDSEATRTIPFKLIAQTRAEKQLVDLFLRRYQNGEDGDYLAEAYYGDGEPLGQTFPGYYYQEVRVCQNCYEVYTLIEQVRMQSLNRIARTSKKQRERSKPVQAPISLGTSLLLPAITNEIDERDEEEVDEDEGASTKQAQEDALVFVWQHLWIQVESIARSITKRDAAELYSFVSPHPAVAMVFSAMSVLLLGKEGDAGAIKRAISQEQLVAVIQKFSPDNVTLGTLLKGADHARNPLFTSENVAPISACAARFCEW